MPELPSEHPHHFPWGRGRSARGDPGSQPLATLRALRMELLDVSERFDASRAERQLPERSLPKRTWERSKRQLQATADMGPLCTDLERAYGQVRRINDLRDRRLFKGYALYPGDDAEGAVNAIRHALLELDNAIDRLEPASH